MSVLSASAYQTGGTVLGSPILFYQVGSTVLESPISVYQTEGTGPDSRVLATPPLGPASQDQKSPRDPSVLGCLPSSMRILRHQTPAEGPAGDRRKVVMAPALWLGELAPV